MHSKRLSHVKNDMRRCKLIRKMDPRSFTDRDFTLSLVNYKDSGKHLQSRTLLQRPILVKNICISNIIIGIICSLVYRKMYRIGLAWAVSLKDPSFLSAVRKPSIRVRSGEDVAFLDPSGSPSNILIEFCAFNIHIKGIHANLIRNRYKKRDDIKYGRISLCHQVSTNPTSSRLGDPEKNNIHYYFSDPILVALHVVYVELFISSML